MKFTVAWTADAQGHLAKIWLEANDKERIDQAVKKIERIPARDAENAGESRIVDIRILIEPPLGIHFDVSPLDCQAKVWRVWRFSN
jgi:hypothetical protein